MVAKQKVYEMVFDKLQQAILTGHYEIGDKLPAERELAALYQVSRNSVREAIRLLELQNFVDIKPGDGTFVKNNTGQHENQIGHLFVSTDSKSLYEMLELRLILEAQCAALAAMRANALDLEQMAQALDLMKAAHDDELLGLQADLNFHIAIAEATHNQVLVDLIASLIPHIRKTIEITRKCRLAEKTKISPTVEEHRQIFIAISRGDSEQAKHLMDQHIRTIRQELSEQLL